MNYKSDRSRTATRASWRSASFQDIKPRTFAPDQEVAGGLVLTEDYRQTAAWRSSHNPPPRVWTTLQPVPGLHKLFAALAEGPADPVRYGDFASQHGLLVHGQNGRLFRAEPYVLWRWHAERMRFLIAIGEVRRLWRVKSYSRASSILGTLRPGDLRPPMLDVWECGSVFPWHKEVHSMDSEQPLSRGGIMLRAEAAAGYFDLGPPLNPDLPRVHHPFHEDYELATLPYVELMPTGRIEVVGAGGHYLTARNKGSSVFPTRGAVDEVTTALDRAFQKVFRSAFDDYWDLKVVGKGRLRLDVGPSCLLGLIYEALFNEVNQRPPTSVRRCLHCDVEMPGAVPQRRYHDECQKRAWRAGRVSAL